MIFCEGAYSIVGGGDLGLNILCLQRVVVYSYTIIWHLIEKENQDESVIENKLEPHPLVVLKARNLA
jgi:hypothetical protein